MSCLTLSILLLTCLPATPSSNKTCGLPPLTAENQELIKEASTHPTIASRLQLNLTTPCLLRDFLNIHKRSPVATTGHSPDDTATWTCLPGFTFTFNNLSDTTRTIKCRDDGEWEKWPAVAKCIGTNLLWGDHVRASQSSNYMDTTGAELAYNALSSLHAITKQEPNPWWLADLGEEFHTAFVCGFKIHPLAIGEPELVVKSMVEWTPGSKPVGGTVCKRDAEFDVDRAKSADDANLVCGRGAATVRFVVIALKNVTRRLNLKHVVVVGFVCPTGYTGDACETKMNYCENDPCENGGTCDNSLFSCTCMDGYHGDRCQLKVDACTSEPCVENATCVVQTEGYRCACPLGYYGNACQVEVDECERIRCQNGGTCIDQVATFTCHCLPEYTGPLCKTFCKNNTCPSSEDRNEDTSSTRNNDSPKKTPKNPKEDGDDTTEEREGGLSEGKMMFVVFMVASVVTVGAVTAVVKLCSWRNQGNTAATTTGGGRRGDNVVASSSYSGSEQSNSSILY